MEESLGILFLRPACSFNVLLFAFSYLALQSDGAGLASRANALWPRQVVGARLDFAVHILQPREPAVTGPTVHFAQVGLKGEEFDGRVGCVQHCFVVWLQRRAVDAATVIPMPTAVEESG